MSEKNKKKNCKTFESDKLKKYFPQYFDKDNKFNLNEFKATLDSENIEYSDESILSQENYSLNFIGKRFAKNQCKQQVTTFMRPDFEHNNKPENLNSNNIYIKGDNLEAIKHLLKAYSGQIKCIYIDPPYNTGTNDFVYSDKFKYDQTALRKMGLSEQEAGMVKGNSTHSAWLAFMMPRLILAKELLSEDGVMFVSIDENEADNLVNLCKKDIFGEDNVDILVWRKNGKQGNTKQINRFKITHEYVVVLYKNKSITKIGKVKLKPKWKSKKSNPDNDPRGNWESGVISRDEENSNKESKNYYSIKLPSGRTITREFYFSKEEFDNYLKENKIYFPKNGDGIPRLKIFENEEQFYYFDSIIDGMGTFTTAKEELEDLFGFKNIFDTPKPVKMIKEFIRTTTNESSYVLDFFSGSATTAHACMELNAENNENRKYILVQLPEPIYKLDNNGNSVPKKNMAEIYKAGYRTVCDIGIDRIKRAAKKIKQETNADIDCGFKIYELI